MESKRGSHWVTAETAPTRNLYTVREEDVKWLPNEGPRPSHIEPFFSPEEEAYLEHKLGKDWWEKIEPDFSEDVLEFPYEDPEEAERVMAEHRARLEIIKYLPRGAGAESEGRGEEVDEMEKTWQRISENLVSSHPRPRRGTGLYD